MHSFNSKEANHRLVVLFKNDDRTLLFLFYCIQRLVRILLVFIKQEKKKYYCSCECRMYDFEFCILSMQIENY